MDLRLKDKVAIVTGSSKGIGKAIATGLAWEGCRLVLCARGRETWDRRLQADPDGIAQFVTRSIPFGRFGKPDEVADAVVFLCSERARWVTGACVTVDGGQSRSNI